MSGLILGFLRRSEDQRAIQKLAGYTVVETEAGPGFVGWGFQAYQPSYPLDQVSLALAQLVKSDKYEPTRVTLASNLPAVWLSSVDDTALKRALTSVRAVATIHADLRPQASPDYSHQSFAMWLAELDDETAAESLFRLSQEKQSRVKDLAMIAANCGRLFCLAGARSFMAGKPSFETPASMQRFSAGIAALLENQYHK